MKYGPNVGWRAPTLQQARLCKRILAATTYYNMVQHSYIQEGKCRAQALCNPAVSTAGLCHTRWMVVGKNHCGGLVLQCPDGDLPGIHGGTVERTEKQVLATQNPVLAVQEQAAEHFPIMATKMILQKAAGITGAAQDIACTEVL